MERIVGNILDVPIGFIVHGCNNRGVMGAGLALAVKQRYPKVYNFYIDEWNYRKGFKLGDVQYVWVDYNKIICNAITQDRYGRDGNRYTDYDAIRKAFQNVLAMAKVDNLPIHFPKIGCKLGGGDWNIVKNIINEVLGDHESYVWVLSDKETI